jgi:hypothetical protein
MAISSFALVSCMVSQNIMVRSIWWSKAPHLMGLRNQREGERKGSGKAYNFQSLFLPPPHNLVTCFLQLGPIS